MSAWIFQVDVLLSLIPGLPTMKFNTALLFFMSAVGTFTLFSKSISSRILNVLLAFIILFISLYTLVEYLLPIKLKLDNILVNDHISKIAPGRMSRATAFCFFIFAAALMAAKYEMLPLSKHINYLLTLIALISVLAVLTYVMLSMGSENVLLFKTMALHTALLFFLLSLSLALLNPGFSYVGFITGNYEGSKLARTLLPFTLLLTGVLSLILLYTFKQAQVDSDSAIARFAILYAGISFLYISYLSNKINRADTGRVQLEKDLVDSNRELWQYKFALDESAIVAITDAHGIIQTVNDKFCSISGYEPNELIGKTHRIINSNYHSSRFFEDMWQTISAGQVWIDGVRNKAKNGDFYWVQCVIVPFKNNHGQIYQYMTIKHDITKLRWMSAQYENLKLKIKEIEQFTYLASHDLQEPLRTLQGMTALLKSQYRNQLDEKGIKNIDFISQASRRMSDLIKALLDYSLIGTDRELEIVDSQMMVEEICLDLALALSESQGQIIFDGLPTLKVYKIEFRLLLQNLIGNSIKFAKSDLAPEVVISTKEFSDYFEFLIKDNGIGIENDGKTREVFGLFKRLHRKDEYDGTGIGLAHCEKIVHLHGGNIWYESKLGHGSNFYFTIPKLLQT